MEEVDRREAGARHEGTRHLITGGREAGRSALGKAEASLIIHSLALSAKRRLGRFISSVPSRQLDSDGTVGGKKTTEKKKRQTQAEY